MQSIFGTDGIRGEFDKKITYSLAYKVGYSLGLIIKNNNPILIGRDTRISGEVLFEAISNTGYYFDKWEGFDSDIKNETYQHVLKSDLLFLYLFVAMHCIIF